ncbi:hypothetical protein IE53DRAFT_225176 [Violaceomyces palustris]|uniref:Uncharacterized protein n=1 Tax=Violaceomyces palustris TaxID=1673888 RepID=A0ACD0NQ46_9BASI|nr:hypothetical protein IE53DRAFT_225176 [Violaceomyces palustris]
MTSRKTASSLAGVSSSTNPTGPTNTGSSGYPLPQQNPGHEAGRGNGHTSQVHHHARASHGGSATNTEMRAILRKERELERARESALREIDVNRKHWTNSNGMTRSISDKKLTQSSSNDSIGACPPSAEPSEDEYDSNGRASVFNQNSGQGGPGSQVAGMGRKRNNTHTGLQIKPREEDFLASAYQPHPHRIPPPPESFDHSFGVDALQAAFSAKYYELANKCKNWEKYAAKLRAQAEVLEVENRVLREQNACLESENSELREEKRHRDLERLRVESRISSLEDKVGRSLSGGDLSGQYRSAENVLDFDIPSAPSSASRSTTNGGQVPYCSSNLQVDDRHDFRPPTPVSAVSLPAPLPNMYPHSQPHQHTQSQSQNQNQTQPQPLHHPSHESSSSQPAVRQRRSHSVARDSIGEWNYACRRGSASLAEIINQDASQRESGSIHAEGRSSRMGGRTLDADSSTMTVSGRTATANQGHGVSALTSQALAAINRQHHATQSRASSTQRVQVSPNEPNTQGHLPSSDGFSHLVSSSQTITKRRSMNLGDNEGNLSASVSAPNLLTSTGLGPASQNGTEARIRGSSAHSDAATVTGHHLQDYVEQRRQQRRTSFNQQQGGGHPPGASLSRPTSRMSNLSANGGAKPRARSRAGSVHDAIPVVKDDLFSEMESTVSDALPSRATSPLVQNDRHLNGVHPEVAAQSLTAAMHSIKKMSSANSVREETENIPRQLGLPPPHRQEAALQLQHGQQNSAESSTGSSLLGTNSDDPDSSQGEEGRTTGEDEFHDQRRAHRQLYANLRAELDASDLTKFEKYVHRYDALEIGLDGPKGLVNRVKKLLLLSDPAIRSKPEKLKARKELAREFERVVRVELN